MHIFVMLPKMHASFENYSLKTVAGDDYTSCIPYNVIAGQSDLVKIKITVISIKIRHAHLHYVDKRNAWAQRDPI